MHDLEQMRNTIENMSKFNQVEILRILSKHNDVTLNENKYGIHVNLSDLKEDIVEELLVYVNYVNAQEMSLKHDEKQKEEFKNAFFSN
jgi:hypothetical protein